MRLCDFYKMRVCDFMRAVIDFHEYSKQKDKFYFDVQRLLITTWRNSQRGKSEPVYKPSDMWTSPFDDDEQTERKYIDADEQKELDRRMFTALEQTELNG